MRVTLRGIFEDEVARHGLTWCTGGCGSRSSHRRGFATAGTVHLAASVATRSTLYRGLHEVAHVVLGHTSRRRGPRWRLEADAEAWTRARMSELGIVPPPTTVAAGDAYVARMQRWGAAISRSGRRR
ncbi:MAG TPA: hypothetical protein VLA82_01505 [Actinomycetota bacterium]|nr:hypothetical protein [Actinomycetota bacterium]